MTSARRQLRLWLIAGTLVSASVFVVTRYTDAFQLREVTYNGSDAKKFEERFTFDGNQSVFEQPLDSLAQTLLSKRNIFRVEIDVRLPDAIDIRTNRFSPVCYVVDEFGGELYGLTEDARAISLQTVDRDWERPLLTGVRVRKLYKRCNDRRIQSLLNQLAELEERNIDLYRLVEQIDLSNSQFLAVNIAGIKCQARVRAEYMADDIVRFADFVARYGGELEKVAAIDMRYDDMLITKARKG